MSLSSLVVGLAAAALCAPVLALRGEQAASAQSGAARRLNDACDDGMCAGLFDKCGGKDFNVSIPCCDTTLSCVTKNFFYAQCIPEDRAASNVAEQGWDGRVLDCEEMPLDAPKGPEESRRRRSLLDLGTYGYGDYGYGDASYGGVYGDYGYGSPYGYGDASEDVGIYYGTPSPSSYGYYEVAPVVEAEPSTCSTAPDVCVPNFRQCGGNPDVFGETKACCDPEASCYVKNYFYAQCLQPQFAERRSTGWDMRTLDGCAPMPADASKAPVNPAANKPDGPPGRRRGLLKEFAQRRSALDVPAYGFGTYEGDGYGYLADYGYGSTADYGYGSTADYGYGATGDYGYSYGGYETTPLPGVPPAGLGTYGCETCSAAFERCGGTPRDYPNGTLQCCDPNTACVVKNYFYAQCLPTARAASNIENAGWDGRELTCGAAMPSGVSRAFIP